MRKSYKIENLDCPCCAEKIERAVAGIAGVTSASINFMAQKLTIVTDSDDQTEIAKEAAKLCSKVDDCELILK